MKTFIIELAEQLFKLLISLVVINCKKVKIQVTATLHLVRSTPVTFVPFAAVCSNNAGF